MVEYETPEALAADLRERITVLIKQIDEATTPAEVRSSTDEARRLIAHYKAFRAHMEPKLALGV